MLLSAGAFDEAVLLFICIHYAMNLNYPGKGEMYECLQKDILGIPDGKGLSAKHLSLRGKL